MNESGNTVRFEELTQTVIGVALRIHRELGPGLLESVYEALLANALRRQGLRVLRQQPVSLRYDGLTIDEGFRVDLLVEQELVIELKSAVHLDPVFTRQLLTYLRLMNLPIGLLINFGGVTLKEGLRRVINSHAIADATHSHSPSPSPFPTPPNLRCFAPSREKSLRSRK